MFLVWFVRISSPVEAAAQRALLKMAISPLRLPISAPAVSSLLPALHNQIQKIPAANRAPCAVGAGRVSIFALF
jgi:hypothetical protein